MKAIVALGFLAAVISAGAGCGASKRKAVELGFTAPTTTTLANVKAGDTIRCGSVGAKVPPSGEGVAGIADGSSSSATIQLTWKDGSLHVSCGLARRPAAAGRAAGEQKQEAKVAAARLLARFVPPPGAMRLRREPHGDQEFLRRRTFAVGGQAVYRHAFWRVDRSIDSVLEFVRAHPPRGPARRSGEGAAAGYPSSGIPRNRTLDFIIRRRPEQWVEVTMAALRDGSTGIRIDAVAGWIIPRSPRERVPSGVREIDIRTSGRSLRVTRAAEVRTIIRWFDALGIVQGGPRVYCPALIGGHGVTFDFRSAGGALLARARLASGSISSACNPIGFSIGGRPQTPLVGLTFWNRVKRLVGLEHLRSSSPVGTVR